MKPVVVISLIFCFLFGLSACRTTQDPLKSMKVTSTNRAERQNSKVARKEDKKKWKQNRETEMRTEKMIKEHHKRIQTKKTRKSMLRNKKKSDSTR